MFEQAATEGATIIPFAAFHRRPVRPAPEPKSAERDEAIERLRVLLSPGSLVHVVRRWYHPDNDWLTCDFFHIDGHFVTCITRDVALAIDRYDPARECGVKLTRSRGVDPLVALIDGTLARLLHGEPGAVQHVLIG